MTEEEKKAIEFIKSELQDEKEVCDDYQSLTGLYGNLEIEIILNLIQKQDTGINKLNNVIDRMAEDMAGTNKAINEEYAVDELYLDKNKIKEYFMKENK